MSLKVGILLEGKIPADRRTPLTPRQAAEVQSAYSSVKIVCQKSSIRCYSDDEYRAEGIPVVADVSDCDILLGIKEVPITALYANKTYLFFSHTIKQQAYNRELLRTILERNIRLIDYEPLTDKQGKRLVAFGKFAGIVGAYNALWSYGKRYALYQLPRAHECFDLQALKGELTKVKLPPIKIAVTGSGRVGQGAQEILDAARIRRVSPQEFLSQQFKEAVYTQLSSRDYHTKKSGEAFDADEFHKHPELYVSDFLKYTHKADILIAGAYWNPKAPRLFHRTDMLTEEFRIRVIADITCDIDGSIPSTRRATTVLDPLYDYDPATNTTEAPFAHRDLITVMAIDNLPSELPRDASEAFGRALTDRVLPFLFTTDSEGVIERATVTRDGTLTTPFQYLQDYVKGTASVSEDR